MEDKAGKLARLQKENPNRYCELDEYCEGFVCFIDILGFSNYVSIEENYIKIRDLINTFLNKQINEEINRGVFNISIASDSVIITVEEKKYFYDFATIIRLVMFFRRLVVEKIGTDIRSGITYGKFVHSGYKGQIYFGPAISRAVKISEKIGNINCKYGEAYQPAGIYLDTCLFENEFLRNCYNIKIEPYMIELNEGRYIINPYLHEYHNKDYFFEQLLRGKIEKNTTKYDYWFKYYNEQYRIITSHDIEEERIKVKYFIYKKMLFEFYEIVKSIDRKELLCK